MRLNSKLLIACAVISLTCLQACQKYGLNKPTSEATQTPGGSNPNINPANQNGGIDGGGGKGIVCRNSQNAIQSVELLDLWESRTLFGGNPKVNSNNLDAEVDAALKRLKNAYPFRGNGTSGPTAGCKDQDCFYQMMNLEAQKFLKPNSAVTRLHGVTLELTNDSFEVARPNDCGPLEQIVDFQKSGQVLINQDIVDKMDILNQTALIAHESFYSVLRNIAGETNSIRARRSIGYVMSGQTFQDLYQDPPADHLFCYNPGTPYAPTELELTWNQNGQGPAGILTGFPLQSNGSKFIGIDDLKGTISAPFDSDQYLSLLSGKCLKNDLVLLAKIDLGGPVEFDRELGLEIHCNNGILETYLLDSKPGSKNTTSTKLTCTPPNGTVVPQLSALSIKPAQSFFTGYNNINNTIYLGATSAGSTCSGAFCNSCDSAQISLSSSFPPPACSLYDAHPKDNLVLNIQANYGSIPFTSPGVVFFFSTGNSNWVPVTIQSINSDAKATVAIPMNQICASSFSGNANCTNSFNQIIYVGVGTINPPTAVGQVQISYRYVDGSNLNNANATWGCQGGNISMDLEGVCNFIGMPVKNGISISKLQTSPANLELQTPDLDSSNSIGADVSGSTYAGLAIFYVDVKNVATMTTASKKAILKYAISQQGIFGNPQVEIDGLNSNTNYQLGFANVDQAGILSFFGVPAGLTVTPSK